ncbi:MAG TPA: hypothetical protein PLQ13_09585, partial [Candidatus Krumholzibacteria bacterium]|nr:hypothetical protein [Candidatus Krumholzibacteria bacterium]
MEQDRTTDRNYWHLFEDAERALAGGDLPAAERLFLAASQRRETSPSRVFFTESISDHLRRFLRRGGAPGDQAGRWERASSTFRALFHAAGERAVREGVRLSELRPEDDADANQPKLTTALFLTVRSRLFPEELGSAVPLLKGLFRTAARTGRLFDIELIRHDVPLTEEDRLWLARRGGDLLEVYVEQGALQRGTGPAREWAAAVLQILQPRYFGTSSRLAEERAWLEAVTADRLQGDAEASVVLYRAYLQTRPEPGPRADEARVRTLELLANIDAAHMAVPRYDEALGALQSAGLAPGSELAGRYGTAVARIEHRRPEPDPGTEPAAWATAALGPDGAVAVVYWWGAEPRDLAWWRPGVDAGALDRFLDPCAGRIIARDTATAAAVGTAWDKGPAPWPVGLLVEALAEPELPRSGLDQDALRRFAAGETGPWRAGWRRDLAHPDLKPVTDEAVDPRLETGLGRALTTGLAVLALRRRVGGSEPALRAGLAELARRGDRAARALYAVLTAGDEAARALDAGFAAWTVPLLWTRPDPFTGSASSAAAEAVAARPDLGRNDVAVVTTGDPAAVLAAWGSGHGRWRVVLDRMERLAGLVPAAAAVVGPVTVIPRDGLVHRLDAALVRLDQLVRLKVDADDPLGGLLAVVHWARIVSTHNGDLLDVMAARPWSAGAFPLYERYAEAIGDLPRERPRPGDDPRDDGWAAQFSQRARKAGFVAGHVDQLPVDAGGLDGLWGVFEGSDASWVFLDGAVVHRRLAAGAAGPQAVHAHLVSRGRRHLTVLTGAVWCREDVEDLLAGWLAAYGPAYRLALTDVAAPPLRLADRGAVPGGVHLAAEALAAGLAHVADAASGGVPHAVVMPQDATGAAFWQAAAAGRFAVPTPHWTLVGTAEAGAPVGTAAVLVVPELDAFHAVPAPPMAEATVPAWREADRLRAEHTLALRRACSLEIAALLAGGWEGVEILDPRWWRLLRDQGVVRDGVQAAAAAAPGRARAFDLPEAAGDARRRLPAALAAEVTTWAAGRGLVTPAAPAPWPQAGSRLEVGAPQDAWIALLDGVASAWERGRTDRWILAVADDPLPGAAGVVQAAASSGCSCWPADPGQPPGPVLWARPSDLLQPELAAYVALHRPAALVVPDFERWLPRQGHAGQVEAAALRALLGLEVPLRLLQAVRMPAPWRSCLEVLGPLAVVGEGEAAAATPAASTADLKAPTLVARLQRLFDHLRPLPDERAAGGMRGDFDGELVPAARLAQLAGIAPDAIADAARTLRWVGRVAGDHLSAADAADAADAAPARRGVRTHAILVPQTFAEIESELDLVGEALGVLLPLWLGRLPTGGRTWVELDQPPAKVDAALLARVDAWLLAVGAEGRGLAWTAPRGVLNSARRLAGVDRPLVQVEAMLRADLSLFRRRVQEVLGAAVETGDGFRIDTG